MIVMIVVFMLRVTRYSSKNTTRSSFCSSARLEKPRKMVCGQGLVVVPHGNERFSPDVRQ